MPGHWMTGGFALARTLFLADRGSLLEQCPAKAGPTRSSLLVLAMLAGAARATTPDLHEVEQLARAALERGEIESVAVALAQDGRIVYEAAFGDADVQAGQEATVHTAYALASVTKPITATTLLALAQRGKVDLEAPFQQVMAPLKFTAAGTTGSQVTLLHLLDHTSGLGTYARIHYGDQIAAAPALDTEFARYGSLVHPPGTVAEYSNLGYGLLGEVVARQGGADFAQVVRDRVFRPLGMDDSFIDQPASGSSVQIAAGYGSKGERLPVLHNNTPGAGNAYASAHDLALFGLLHDDPTSAAAPVLNAASVSRMQRCVHPAALQQVYGDACYGLGWYVRGKGAQRLVWHEGGMPGASSIIAMLPARRLVAVALANRTDANATTQALAHALLRAAAPDYQVRPLDPVEGYVPYRAQPAYAGDFSGSLTMDGRQLPCTLAFGKAAEATLRCTDGKDGKPVVEGRFKPSIRGNSLASAFAGTLPARDLAESQAALLLVKLVRKGDRLDGTLVAYAAPERLELLLPFALHLRREVD